MDSASFVDAQPGPRAAKGGSAAGQGPKGAQPLPPAGVPLRPAEPAAAAAVADPTLTSEPGAVGQPVLRALAEGRRRLASGAFDLAAGQPRNTVEDVVARPVNLDGRGIDSLPLLVLDADGDQHAVLVDVLEEGRNLVLEGPTGSGKTQTLVNLIGAAAMAGKTTLLLAPDQAGVDAWRTRLEHARLSAFALTLTDADQALEALGRRLALPPGRRENLAERRAQLEGRKKRLARYARLMNAAFGTIGLPPHEILWALERYREELEDAGLAPTPVDLPDLVEPNATEISALRGQVARLRALLAEYLAGQSHKAHAWRGFVPAETAVGGEARPSDDAQMVQNVLAAVTRMEEGAARARGALERLRDCAEVAFPITAKAAEQLLGLRGLVRKPPEGAAVELLPHIARDRAGHVVERVGQRLNGYRVGVQNLRETFGEEWAGIDRGEVLGALGRRDEILDAVPEDTRVDHMATVADDYGRGIEALREASSFFARLCGTLGVDLPESPRAVRFALDVTRLIGDAPFDALGFRCPELFLPDSRDTVARAREEAAALLKRKVRFTEIFQMQGLPDAETLSAAAESLSRDGIAATLSKGRRDARRLLADLVQPGRKDVLNRPPSQLANALTELAAWRRDAAEFDRSATYRDSLGPGFNGIQTQFDKFEALFLWFDALQEAADGRVSRDVAEVDGAQIPQTADSSEAAREDFLANLDDELPDEADAVDVVTAEVAEGTEPNDPDRPEAELDATEAEPAPAFEPPVVDAETRADIMLKLMTADTRQLAVLRGLAIEAEDKLRPFLAVSDPVERVQAWQTVMGDIKAAAKHLRRLGVRGEAPVATAYAALDSLLAMDDLRDDIETDEEARDLMGARYQGLDTDMGPIEAARRWARAVQDTEDLPGRLARWLVAPEATARVVEFEKVLTDLDAGLEGVDGGRERFAELGELDWDVWCDHVGREGAEEGVDGLSLQVVEDRGRAAREALDRLPAWRRYCRARAGLQATGLAGLVTASDRHALSPNQLTALFEFSLCEKLSANVLRAWPELVEFSREDHERTRAEFGALDREILDMTRQTAYADLAERGRSDMREIAPLAQLLETGEQPAEARLDHILGPMRSILAALTPILVTTPEQARHWLAGKDLGVDIAVVDDAERFPADAAEIGLAYGRQAVIAGRSGEADEGALLPIARQAFAPARRLTRRYAAGGDEPLVMLDPETKAEHFEAALQRLLARHGYEARVGVQVGGRALDLAVRHPDRPEAFILAIEGDGPRYGASRSTRDRDRLDEEALRGLGCLVYRIWTVDWHMNREDERRRLLDSLAARVRAVREAG